MEAVTLLSLSMLILFVFLAMHQHVGAALGLTAMLLLYFFVGKSMPLLAIIGPWDTLNNFDFIALPGYILTGNIIMHSGLGMSIYQGAAPWVSRLPGGLLNTNIIACSIFAAISGSSAATAATIGAVAIPEQTKLGYDRKFLLGTLAGAGTLGLLIPPSISFIVYAALTGVSVGHLFIAGVIPGIILATMFLIYTIIQSIRNPQLIPRSDAHPTKKELVQSIRFLWPALLLIGGIMAFIFFGIATVIEVSAIGVVAALIIAAIERKLSWKVIVDSFNDSIRTLCLMNFVVIGALVLQFCWGNLMIPRKIAIAMSQTGLPLWGILILIYVFYLFLGCLFDGVSMMILTLPVVYPLITAYNLDPIWFGVVLTVLIEIAQITPPIGFNLYVLSGIARCPISEVVAGSFPFFCLLLAGLTLFTIFPDICTWLPRHMLGK